MTASSDSAPLDKEHHKKPRAKIFTHMRFHELRGKLKIEKRGRMAFAQLARLFPMASTIRPDSGTCPAQFTDVCSWFAPTNFSELDSSEACFKVGLKSVTCRTAVLRTPTQNWMSQWGGEKQEFSQHAAANDATRAKTLWRLCAKSAQH